VGIFNIWSFGTLSDARVRIDITPGNVPQLGRGNHAWIEGLLSSINVRAKPLSWTIMPWRCHFYSDYPLVDDWQDRWPTGWTIIVTTNGNSKPIIPAVLKSPIPFEELDPSWDGTSDAPGHDRCALLIAMRRNRESKKQELADLAASTLPKQVSATVESDDTAEVEFRAFARDVTFPACVTAMDEFIMLAERRGWFVNWQNFASGRHGGST
jgi:hypothetical protein